MDYSANSQYAANQLIAHAAKVKAEHCVDIPTDELIRQIVNQADTTLAYAHTFLVSLQDPH